MAYCCCTWNNDSNGIRFVGFGEEKFEIVIAVEEHELCEEDERFLGISLLRSISWPGEFKKVFPAWNRRIKYRHRIKQHAAFWAGRKELQ